MATDGSREKRELHDLVEKLPPIKPRPRFAICIFFVPIRYCFRSSTPHRTMSLARTSSGPKTPRLPPRSPAARALPTRRSRAELRRIDRDTAMRILTTRTRYAETGEGDVKALEGKFTSTHRLRVGDWRLRFRRVGASIHVLAIENRGEHIDEQVVDGVCLADLRWGKKESCRFLLESPQSSCSNF